MVLEGKRPPYVPWHFTFTKEAAEKLVNHFGTEENVDAFIDDHIVELRATIGFFTDIGNDKFRDVFGVTCDRGVDKDIGIVEECVLM
jgi:uroporphyrinogen decarboxylase